MEDTRSLKELEADEDAEAIEFWAASGYVSHPGGLPKDAVAREALLPGRGAHYGFLGSLMTDAEGRYKRPHPWGTIYDRAFGKSRNAVTEREWEKQNQPPETRVAP